MLAIRHSCVSPERSPKRGSSSPLTSRVVGAWTLMSAASMTIESPLCCTSRTASCRSRTLRSASAAVLQAVDDQQAGHAAHHLLLGQAVEVDVVPVGAGRVAGGHVDDRLHRLAGVEDAEDVVRTPARRDVHAVVVDVRALAGGVLIVATMRSPGRTCSVGPISLPLNGCASMRDFDTTIERRRASRFTRSTPLRLCSCSGSVSGSPGTGFHSASPCASTRRTGTAIAATSTTTPTSATKSFLPDTAPHGTDGCGGSAEADSD